VSEAEGAASSGFESRYTPVVTWAEGAQDHKLYVLPASDQVIVRLGVSAWAGFRRRFRELLTVDGFHPESDLRA